MCFVISLLALWRNKQSKKHLDWSDTINRKQPLVLSGYPHCRYREEDKDLETQMLAKGLRLATLRQRKESQVWCLWNRLRHPLHFKRRTFVNIYFFFCPCRLSSYRVSSVHGIPSVLRKNDLKKNVVNFFFSIFISLEAASTIWFNASHSLKWIEPLDWKMRFRHSAVFGGCP